MKQIIQNLKNGRLSVEEVPIPVLRSGGVLVKSVYSLVSAGTERMLNELAKKSLIGKAKERPDLVRQVVDKIKTDGLIPTVQKVLNRLDFPMPLGYSTSGIVVAIGDEAKEVFKIGDRVACGGSGYANHADYVFVPKNLCVKIPDGVDFESAAFTTLGAIALQGVRQADINIGEVVAIIGLGLVGQLTIQILKTSGCKVIGFDINPERGKLATNLGADSGCHEIFNFKKETEFFSKGNGVDAVVITASTKSSEPVKLAGKVIRKRGKVVIVGDVRLDIPRKLYYEKELDVRLSMSYGPGRYDPLYEEKGIDYPLPYVRWTEKRNMEAFLDLIKERKLDVKSLITHRFHIEEAKRAYQLISRENKEPYLAILLKYNNEGPDVINKEKIHLTKNILPSTFASLPLCIGVVGAGDFANGVLLPILKNINGLKLKGVATATGITARHAGEKFGFEYCTSSYMEILNDPEINCVFIATRHDLHAKLACEALGNGKHVFLEKPLALNEEELKEVVKSKEKSQQNLMVGFNRRFSSFSIEAKSLFSRRANPLIVSYRINAGFIPKNHWTQDIKEGGGRIIGEICHFIDLMQFLVGSPPIKVYAEGITPGTEGVLSSDNLVICIRFKDGSIGNITYSALGNKKFSKERIEIFGDNSIFVIDDFRSSEWVGNGTIKKRKKWFGQDKGHKEEIKTFIKALLGGEPLPIDFNETVITTLTTFKIIESLSKGIPVKADIIS